MIVKRAYVRGTDPAIPSLSVITPGDRLKVAYCKPDVQAFVNELRPDPRYTYGLGIAMGYSEFYGSNSNADWYGYNPHLDFNGLLHAWPDIGRDREKDKMKAKLWPYGYPCFYNATAYAHHKNFDPMKFGFGDVVYVALNQEMKRVELCMRIFNDEIRAKGHGSLLDRIHNGGRVDWSMGCRVPFDLCSICTDWDAVKRAWGTFDEARHAHPGIAILASHRNKKIRGLAITREDYCEHMKNAKNRLNPDGSQVFVYNDFCRFFDISIVWIGADPTAKVMIYVCAPPEPTKTSATLLKKVSVLKRSEIDKEVPGGLLRAVDSQARSETPIDSNTLTTFRNRVGAQRTLSILASLGIILSPEEFQVVAGVPVAHGVFRPHSAGADLSMRVDGHYADAELASKLSAWLPTRSAFDVHLRPRLVEIGASRDKASSVETPLEDRDGFDLLARAYNGYRLSVLQALPELVEKLAEDLDLESGFSDQFLLGPAAAVHFISAHLPTEKVANRVGIMAGACGTPPSIKKLSTFGGQLLDLVCGGHTIPEALTQLVDPSR